MKYLIVMALPHGGGIRGQGERFKEFKEFKKFKEFKGLRVLSHKGSIISRVQGVQEFTVNGE